MVGPSRTLGEKYVLECHDIEYIKKEQTGSLFPCKFEQEIFQGKGRSSRPI